ncbi:hypothetical protein [Archangium lipolyticum]|uniref:hypothetical protein n=1 Tax=Archangium lipolyticum TaxID=2970465 RepID=UPI00214A8756|nr:hypothetical protein [Archangium lipolyticum]
MSVFKEVMWSGVLGLGFEISIWKRQDGRQRVLCVKLSGKYWMGPGSPEGGVFIAMIVGAAMANPRGSCQGFVLDLRELEYPGGDMLFYWRDVLNRFKLPAEGYGLTLVCSDANRARVQSLIEDEERTELRLALSVEEAVECILGGMG